MSSKSDYITTGCDLVRISKFARSLREHKLILDNIFTPQEKSRQEPAHLAGIFAAKEATLKALDLEPGSWLKMEITRKINKAPQINLLETELKTKIKQISVSISHDGDYAMSVVVAVLK